MNNILTLIISILILTSYSCKNKESFEGIITYKISFVPQINNKEYIDYQKQKYGNQMILYINKNGQFRRDYINSGEKGFDYLLYNPSSNKYYTKWRNIDTIYEGNALINSLKLVEEKKLEKAEIMGQECNGYYISGIDKKGNQNVSLSYYYPLNKEYINPKLYTKFNDFFYNKVINIMSAPYYKLVMDMQYYSVTFEIESIKKTKVDLNIFNLPKDLPYKEN